MEINLLPRRSPLKKYRMLLIVCSAAVLFLGVVFGAFAYVDLYNRILVTQTQLTRVTSENVILRSQRTITSKDKAIQNVQADVKTLKDREYNDGVMLDGIAAKLSDKTKVVSAAMDSTKQTINLTIQSESMNTIAEYAVLLRQEPWVQDVFVGEIHNDQAAQQDAGSQAPASGNSNALDPNQKERPFTANFVIQLQPQKANAKSDNQAKK